MNASRLPITPRTPRQIAQELCQLFQEQIDDLQRGSDLPNLERYLKRREQIAELEELLKKLRR
jgi:hypothetical protein